MRNTFGSQPKWRRLRELGTELWLDTGDPDDVMDRVPAVGPEAAYIKQEMRDKLIEHNLYVREHGQDMPEIRQWQCRVNDGGKTKAPPTTLWKIINFLQTGMAFA